MREPTIYFEAQTGSIRLARPAVSNFHQYELPVSVAPFLRREVEAATVGPGGMEYKREFLLTLAALERRHRL